MACLNFSRYSNTEVFNSSGRYSLKVRKAPDVALFAVFTHPDPADIGHSTHSTSCSNLATLVSWHHCSLRIRADPPHLSRQRAAGLSRARLFI